MTIFIPLDASAPLPPSPHFLVPSTEPTTHVQKVIKAILKSRRIAVLCGAGISVKAGIPDFRSETGLFHTLKKDHTSLSSGKDLFDASVFNSESTTTLFCKMIAGLAELAQTAQPTPFHRMLRALDDRGRLLRVYTQNIDALESKAGLTFGVPELDVKRSKPRSSKGVSDSETPTPGSSANMTAGRLPTPPAETPRCIPLHGTLQSMHCQICLHSFPLEQHLGSLNSGTFPICPDCSQTEETRQAVGKRSRGVGKLRPSVVLYNELHKDGEEVGGVVARDLVGSSKGKGRTGADLLIVVGTSLRVPGTKRMVREFSKALHSRSSAGNASQGDSSTAGASSSSAEEDHPVKTIYLNLDFPVPTREWEGVFDVWLRGDAQTFARLVQEEIERDERAREAALERKRRREEIKAEVEAAKEEEERRLAEAQTKASGKGKVKGKAQVKVQATNAPSKKRKAGVEPVKKSTTKRSKISGEFSGSQRSKLSSKEGKCFNKIPPMVAKRNAPRREPTVAERDAAYRPLTPPPSQRTRARSPTESQEDSYSSSPLSTAPSSSASTPGELDSGNSSPLTQLPSSPSLETPTYFSSRPSPTVDVTASRTRRATEKGALDSPVYRSPSVELSMTPQLSSPPPTPPRQPSQPLSLSHRHSLRPSISRKPRRTVLGYPPPVDRSSRMSATFPTATPSLSTYEGGNLSGHVQHAESFVRSH